MVIRSARLLAQTIGLLLLMLVAAAGLAAAVFCIQSRHASFSLAGLATDLHLPELRGHVRHFLDTVQDPGSVAVLATLAGAGAILLGLVLLLGLIGSPRERLIRLGTDADGQLLARRRALASAVGSLASQPEGVRDLRVRARPYRRKPGGRVRIRARVSPPRTGSGEPAPREQITAAVAPLVDSLPLRARVRTKRAKTPEPERRRVL